MPSAFLEDAMPYITIDPSEGANGSSCSKCCCAPLGMKPGEVVRMTLNYSMWAIPIGGRGLVPTPQFSIVENNDACSSAPIDGFGNPTTGNVIFNSEQAVAQNTSYDFDMSSDTYPAGNTFTYTLEPVSGPLHGVLSNQLGGSNLPPTGNWRYTGNIGFNGWDQFWVRIKDAQGRQIVRPVNLKVGGPSTTKPIEMNVLALGLIVDRSKVEINNRMNTISFPMLLQPSASCDTVDGCKKWRVTIKAFADDCDNTFSKIDCIDVFCKKC